MKKILEDYKKALDELYTRNLFSRGKYDLSRIKKILDRVGNPEMGLRAIHVGGTNGKGSVTTKIASALQKEGYRVGLFTSPHIASFRERIQVDQILISIEEAESFLRELLSLDEEATFFEITTVMAFLYFVKMKIDFGVIEVGLGGRLDATNVLFPELSVITSIGLDHIEILGSTCVEILEEKKGIIKPPAPCILGPRVPRFSSEAPLYWAESDSPFYDEENSATAKLALTQLQKKFRLSQESILYGLTKRPPCRLEWIRDNVILDVAHNPDGFRALQRALPQGQKLYVLAISKTKDIRAILREIQPECAYLICTEAQNGRSYTADQLVNEARSLGFLDDKIEIKRDPKEAIMRATSLPYLVVVSGSFFIMGDVKKALGISLEEDPFDLNERVMSYL